MRQPLIALALLLALPLNAQVSREAPFFGKQTYTTTIQPPQSGLILWAKSESLTNSIIATNSGDKVWAWLDSSGNGNHITNSDAASQATLLTGQVNGLPAARFDGTTNSMFVPTLTLGSNYTVGVMFKIDAAFSYKPLLWDSNAVMVAVADSVNLALASYGAVVGFSTTNDVLLINNWMSAMWVCTNGVTEIWNNAVTGAATSTPGSSAMGDNATVTVIGAKADGANVNGATPIFLEILVWNRPLTTADRLQYDTYINAKF